MARRGFFAELQYQGQLAEKRRLQAQRASAREHAAAQRAAERARQQSERAAAQWERAAAAQQKEAEREAKRLHVEARLAEVASLNAQLAETFDEIDSMLAATLDVDDFVDLDRLRSTATHPPFPRADLEVPTPPPDLASAPEEPAFVAPEMPTGLGAVFGGKKKHAEVLAAAQAAFDADHQRWQAEAAAVPARQLEQMQRWDAAEQERLAGLAEAREAYRDECHAREVEAAGHNHALADLIGGIEAGADSAIQVYVGIVLSNSVYPPAFPVDYEFAFDSELEELALVVLVPSPSHLPSEREYKYVKARDEITAVNATKRDLKDRYANAVSQVALRTLHEVFEADRAGRINTIALTVATEGADPATGRDARTALIAVAAERETFGTIDLRNVVPAATLEHLGASVSRSPYDLVAIDGSRGVRVR